MGDQKPEEKKPEEKKQEEKKQEEKKPEEKKQETFDAAYVATLRQEAAKYRTQANENAEKAKKLDEQVESEKSDLQKAMERADRAESAAASSEAKRLRSEVARAKGVPSSMSGRLAGKTKEEMEADADLIIADLGKSYVPKAGKSQESTGAGVGGGDKKYEEMTPGELAKLSRTGR